MTELVVGLDTNSHSFHAVASEAQFTYSAHVGGDNIDVKRAALYQFAQDYFWNLEQKREPGQSIHVFCEEPLALKNGKTTRVLALATGAIWAAHLQFDITWWWVDVSSWKKEIVGNGNAKKEMVKEWVWINAILLDAELEKYNKELDFYDAHCLMLYGQNRVAEMIDA